MEQALTSKISRQSWRDYLMMTKPKVVLLLLITALVGMCLAEPNGLPSVKWVSLGLIGIGCLAGSAAVFNHVFDRVLDAKMQRTQHRPLAEGRIPRVNALSFAFGLFALGFLALLQVNLLTAWLTVLSLVGYAVIYTLWLKPATPQNIVIGGLAGAAPPLLGWTCIAGETSPEAWLLVILIFLWTPPHFWALAIHRYRDYEKAGVPMLPVTHGIELTKTMMLLYCALLCVAGVFPWLIGMSSLVYLFGALALNLGLFAHAWKLKFSPEKGDAWAMFKYSIWQLFGLFILLLGDHWWMS